MTKKEQQTENKKIKEQKIQLKTSKKSDKKDIKTIYEDIKTFLEECIIELKKVQWPTRKQATAETLVVLSTVLVVITAISLFDFLLNFVFRFIIPK